MEHGYYVADGAWLSNFCHCLAILRAPSVQNWSIFENKKKSSEFRSQKVRTKSWLIWN